MTMHEMMMSRVLIVEDDEQILKLLSTIVVEESMLCERAGSATEAEQLLQSLYFDAVFIDKNLPDADGIRVAERARALQARVAIFIITGYPTEESAREAAALGVDDYIVKPIDVSEFRRLLKTIRSRRDDIALSSDGSALEDEGRPTLIPKRKRGRPPRKRVTSLKADARGEQHRQLALLEHLSVLLLDADLQRRSMIRSVLEDIECTVTAFSPSDSLATLLEDERFDVIVASPELLTLYTNHLAENEDRRPLVTMAIMEERGVQPVIDAIRFGARGVLAPPFDRATVVFELTRAVSRALEETTQEIDL